MSGAVTAEQRHTKAHRCPVCDGADGDPRGKGLRCSGFTSTDGEWALCARHEFAGGIDASGAGLFAHRLRGSCSCGSTHGPDLRTSNGTRERYKHYDYRDEHGAPAYQVVRAPGKTFYQRRPDGAGGWINGRGDVPRVLYMLPELVAADPTTSVHIVEGEKDVETLVAKGLTATCNPEGAEKFHHVADLARRVLADRDVVVCADADEVGRRHARQVEAALRPVVRSLRVVEPPAPHKDVSDLLAAGGTLDQLVPLAAESPAETPPPTREPTPTGTPARAPRRLSDAFAAGLERAERRCDGREKPIALPWPVLAEHFGGGLWPGLHVINKGTGVGGTQLVLQVATFAAKNGVPVLYIGLELGDLDLALRVLGEEARVPWSHLWTGQAGPTYLERVRKAVPALQQLPFHYEVARPHGFPPSAILAAIESMRVAYPETDGAGSRPILVAVDFVQLVGDEPNDQQDLRVRIGRASYVFRDAANRLGASILGISSVARERYKLVNEIQTVAKLAWDEDANGCPVRRRILDPDAIVGAGKESGEIEYSADSVSVLARVPETWNDQGCDVVFATAKGRATGPMWSPLRFTGYRYEECSDRGGRMLEAWAAARDRRKQASEQKRAANEEKRLEKIAADADAIRSYVAAHPGCGVTEARRRAVGGQDRRWAPAVDLLGKSLVQEKTGSKVSLTLEGVT